MNNLEELPPEDIKRLQVVADMYAVKGSITAGMVKQLIAQLEAAQKEIKRLKAPRLHNQPFAWGLADKNGNVHWSECCIGDKDSMDNEARNYNDYVNSEDDYITAVPLFTAAKPAGPVILPTPANYQDYGPMISLETTMAALAVCGIEYTVKQ